LLRTVRIALVLLVVATAIAATGAGRADAARGMKVGIFDEAQTLYGNPDRTFPMLRSLRTQMIRVALYWGGEFGVANRRPRIATDPEDPAYDWELYDRLVHYASQYGIQVVFSIWGTPGWANRFRGLRSAPLRMLDLRQFAFAAGRRYGGTWVGADGRGIPVVRHWLAWNEPNNPSFLHPQFRIVRGRAVMQSAINYAQICNSIYNGIHAGQINILGERVACGVTGPRGNNNPNSVRASVTPLPFLRAAKRAGMRRIDAYAHHPYYGRPVETPATPPNGRKAGAVTLGNINDLDRELRRLYRRPVRIWITEYGYQTRPPDRIFGVSFANQARYLAQAFALARRHPRIDMMLWFLLRDESRIGAGWQSGLLTSSGRRKPAFAAFQRVPR
jgi:hypothetical protein